MQRAGRIGDRVGGDARQARSLGLELVRDERDIGVRTVAAALGAGREGRGLQRPSCLGQRGTQFVPAGIADGFRKPREGGGISAGFRRKITHRAGGGVVIVGGDETPDLLQAQGKRWQRNAQFA
jgi:hypothetical protein